MNSVNWRANFGLPALLFGSLLTPNLGACNPDPNWKPEVTPGNTPVPYSPALREDTSGFRTLPPDKVDGFPDQVYFGDTHVHTSLSNDAFAMGNITLSPDQAYAFGKGQTVLTHGGMEAKLSRPLDFLVVADHANNMGVMARISQGDPQLLNTEQGKIWQARLSENYKDIKQSLNGSRDEIIAHVMTVFFNQGGKRNLWQYFSEPRITDTNFRQSVWDEVIASAERHNDPGKFTAFIGYEWTGDQQGAQHRNVIFKDGADKVSQVLPFSKYDSYDPEDLWAYMDAYTETTGGDVIAIPHNANISGGATFGLTNFQGHPLTKAYANKRIKWEPISEVTQYKGDGEAYPLLSPDDEFADYETWHSWGGPDTSNITFDEEWLERKRGDYARPALKRGLAQQAKLGTNPFKFGMIGSTDAHTSLATAEEDNFWGTYTLYEPNAFRSLFQDEFAASGYAAVWATENTREALFAGMRRKETYATTGTRIRVRFFGGWDFQSNHAASNRLAAIGYERGVPMGSDLLDRPPGQSPSFLIQAMKDPNGANLDRIQVIKGWRTADGALMEQVFDVAVSDGREIPKDGGKVQPVGSTVDVESLTYSNSIGDAVLSVVWTDPQFNLAEDAFYYARVIEIPTPRWSAYDRKFFKIENRVSKGAPLTTQERAYTSPIWYSAP